MNKCLFFCLLIIGSDTAFSQNIISAFTKYDTLRGSITTCRKGWDVMHYDLTVQPDIKFKTLKGKIVISYYESEAVKNMQIDLQQPLMIDSLLGNDNQTLTFRRDSNVCIVNVRDSLTMYKISPGMRKLTVFYHGQPKEAKRPPWDGGMVWQSDSLNRPFIGTACQGTGASIWWPCKDHQSDEPDSGANIHLIIPDTLIGVSNGRLQSVNQLADGYKIWHWVVTNPINTYNITMNIGNYKSWSDTLMGVVGKLDLQYWVLDYNLEKAKKQFEQVKPMLRNHEFWFGKYPFYEDGYKLIEAPFLGMEHQSGVAYGNLYQNGYKGRDLSNTGHGLQWDFIIVHESGHEWFGNNITTNDIADMWIHEGFTNYSEVLYTQTLLGKQAAQEYCIGLRKKVKNDTQIIGKYGVNSEGSSDKYYKASNMINMIRFMINDDEKFRNILIGLNTDYFHKQVSTTDIEDYINRKSGINFSKIFNQYLRTTQIPTLEYYYDLKKKKLHYHWSNSIKEFNLPLVYVINGQTIKLFPREKWKKKKVKQPDILNMFTSNENSYYFIQYKSLQQKP